jgi:CHAD domain-containing protein
MSKLIIPDIAALHAGVSPVTPEDPMPEAGRKILLLNLMTMLEHQEKLSGDNIMHQVHQMRVATRRIRSAFRVFKDYYQSHALRPILKGLRKTARLLGDARDLDVLLANMQTYQEMLEGDIADAFKPILEDLEKDRDKARAALSKWANSKAYSRFLSKFIVFVTTVGINIVSPSSKTDPYQVRHVVPVILHQQLAQVRGFDSFIPEAKPELLHALRIELKRLRYLLTFFVDNIGTSAADFIEEIKLLQDHLGRLNDAVVACQRLSDEDLLTNEQIEALAPYRQTLEEQQSLLISEFADLWTHFNTRTVQRKLSDALLVTR